MFGVTVVYAGLTLLLAGFISLVRPLKFLAIRTRKRAALIMLGGFLCVAIGATLPANTTRVETPKSRLDDLLPEYQFHEVHQIHVAASPSAVYAAIKQVTPEEIFLFRTLTSIPRIGRHTPPSIMNPTKRRPILETATRTGFLVLVDDPDREFVTGFIMGRRFPKIEPAQFKDVRVPDTANVAMNFRIEDDPAGGCLLTTETRIYATNAYARSAFAAYWRLIYPGSAFIRRMWLRAIRIRAESAAPPLTSSAGGSLLRRYTAAAARE